MDDKQIIIDGVDVSGCGFIAKEDEYSLYDRVYKGQCRCSNEEMCKDHPNCFYKKALKQLKCKEKECEEFKKQVEVFTRQLEKANKEVIAEKEKNATRRQKNEKLEQVVAKIKPILELYANSKVGEEQLDGTYKIFVEDLKVLGGTYITYYDPRPAKQALQKISEVEINGTNP